MTDVSFGAIPAASDTASGIVTTGNQTFAGTKTFTSAPISANGIIFDSGSSYIEFDGHAVSISGREGINLFTDSTSDITLSSNNIKLKTASSNNI